MIKNGSLVKLLSGGPLMTIMSYENDQYECIWWVEIENRYHVRSFPKDTLVEMTFTLSKINEIVRDKETQILQNMSLNELRALDPNDEIC